MTKLFDTESQEWKDAKEVSSHVDLAEMYLEVAQKGNLKHINQFFAQDVKPKWQKDFDARNIKRDIYNWVDEAHGTFFSHEIDKELDIPDKKYRSKLLKLLEKEGKIEKCKDRPGKWRKVDNNRQIMEWWGADGEEVGMHLPLGVHEQALIYKATMIAVAGKWNSGKSAYCLETATLNYGIYNDTIDYILCDEMGKNRFRRRLKSGGVNEDEFREHVEVFEYVGGYLPDLIRPNKLTIIDYITPPSDGQWKIGELLADINVKICDGVVVLAMQKPRGRDTAYGGDYSAHAPSIYISLDDGLARLVKIKEFDEEEVTNPNGKIMSFKLHGGFHFETLDQWHHKDDEDAVKEASYGRK